MKHKKQRSKKQLGVIIAVLTAFSCGFYPAATKHVYEAGGNAVFMIAATLFSRTLSLIVFCLLTQKKMMPSRSKLRAIFKAGFCQFIAVVGIFVSMIYLAGPVVIVILFSHTLMLLFYQAFKGERILDRHAIICTAVALFGLTLVLDLWGHLCGFNSTGFLLAIISAVATMMRLYTFEHQIKGDNPAVVGAQIFIVVSLLTVLFMLFFPLHFPETTQSYFWAAGGCLSLILGTFGMFYSIALLGAFEYSMLVKLEPVFTSIFSALLVPEILLQRQYMGIILVISTLAYYQYFQHQTRKKMALIPSLE